MYTLVFFTEYFWLSFLKSGWVNIDLIEIPFQYYVLYTNLKSI